MPNQIQSTGPVMTTTAPALAVANTTKSTPTVAVSDGAARAVVFPSIPNTPITTHRSKSAAEEVRTSQTFIAVPSKTASALSKTPALFGSYSAAFADPSKVDKPKGSSVTLPVMEIYPCANEAVVSCPPNTPSGFHREHPKDNAPSPKNIESGVFPDIGEDCKSDTRTIGSEYSSFDTLDAGIGAVDVDDDPEPCPDDGTIIDDGSMDIECDDDSSILSPEKPFASPPDSYTENAGTEIFVSSNDASQREADPMTIEDEGSYNRLHNQRQLESLGQFNRSTKISGGDGTASNTDTLNSSSSGLDQQKALDGSSGSNGGGGADPEPRSVSKPRVVLRYCEPPVGILGVMRSVSLNSILPPSYYKQY
jgi:hypothetical protein